MSDRDRLVAQLLLHEGLRLKPYKDTIGKLTIGVGFNLTDRGLPALEAILGHPVDLKAGITRSDAIKALKSDLDDTIRGLAQQLLWFSGLNPVRQRVLVDMAFNLGMLGLLKFKATLKCIECGDYNSAATQMLRSKWAKQVGDEPGQRAHTLSAMMRSGQDVIQFE